MKRKRRVVNALLISTRLTFRQRKSQPSILAGRALRHGAGPGEE